MVSFFKNFNKLDLAAFEADTEITESFGVIYWLCLCLLNKSGSRGCVLQRLYSQLQTQSTIFSRLKAQEPRSKRWQGCGATKNCLTLFVGMQNDSHFEKQFLIKLIIHLIVRFSNPIPGYFLREMKTSVHKKTCT